MCLYDFLKDNEFAPFPRQHIQSFARQLLGSVACKNFIRVSFLFHTQPFSVLHDLHLIHTDLKPENILLVHNDYKTVPVPVPGKVSISDLVDQLRLTMSLSPAKRPTQSQADIALYRYPAH
jgi:dual-specificity kinase